VPKPELPIGCICHKCRVQLTQQELDSFTVMLSKFSLCIKWKRIHEGCLHKQSSSVNPTDFAIMLSQLTIFERYCVRISVSNFFAAKKAIKLQLAADAVEMEDGLLDDEPELDDEEELEEEPEADGDEA